MVSHSFAFLLSEIFVVGFIDSRMDGFASWGFSEQLKNAHLETSDFFWVCVLWLVSQDCNGASFCPCQGVCLFAMELTGVEGLNLCSSLSTSR